jgi:hypothetical protein
MGRLLLLCAQLHTGRTEGEIAMPNETIPAPPGQDDETADRDDRPKVRIASHGGTHGRHGELHAYIHGFDFKELELMRGAMHGHQWVTCENGRIKNVPSYEELPGPATDESMMPFWRRPAPGEEVQLSLFSFEPLPVWASPSITIGSLCGYYYSEENYAREAKKLTRWGFACLRSQRDDAGQFHEQWYLSGLWAAKGELKGAIDALDPYIIEKNTAAEFLLNALGRNEEPRPLEAGEGRRKRELEVAIKFLCHSAQFGTLDVSVQRAAMVID